VRTAILSGLSASLGFWVLIPSGFWMLMIFDCVRNERDRQTWLWILLFLNVLGAVIYFFACWLPRANLPIPTYFKGWTHRQQLWNAESAVRNIGKAHQYVTLGNVLLEMGRYEPAQRAFQTALEKEPKNPNALWGCTVTALKFQQLTAAKEHLQHLLKLEPDHKMGEASLAYGKVLFELQDWEAAQKYLEQDIKRWSHPESALLLATIYNQNGDVQSARDRLETMIANVRSAPVYHYRRHQHILRRAERLLKSLS
jgi:hypothetical protein